MDHQDLREIIIRGGSVNTKINDLRNGNVEAVMKKKVDRHLIKIDNANEVEAIEKVNMDIRRIVQKTRTEKSMTQKQLAERINVKYEIIRDLESGKLAKDTQLLSKLQRVLGVRLLGKNIGEPFTFAKKK
jgi:putative transcription factor